MDRKRKKNRKRKRNMKWKNTNMNMKRSKDIMRKRDTEKKYLGSGKERRYI